MSTKQKAEDIALDIFARMQQITVANGAETDIGLKVFRGKRKVDDDEAPCCVLVEGPDTPVDRPGKLPTSTITQTYILVGYLACDADNPNDAAHKIIRDFKRAIFKGDGTLGGAVIRANYRGRDIGPRADGVNIVTALIEITIDYVEDLTNP